MLKKVNTEAKIIAKSFDVNDKLNLMVKQQHSVTTNDKRRFSEKTKTTPFDRKHMVIRPKDMGVIFHCRKSLLYHKKGSWIKNDDSIEFEVIKGSYDRAEVSK